ncbi:MAG: PAS domain S-box protein [Candidatus Omnitrophica bacterium]|nr:PAS domain S-box protein [Candidatus Omnitrophota bacterium]
MPRRKKIKKIRLLTLGFMAWFIGLIFLFAVWIYIERLVWGPAWFMPPVIYFLHLARGISITVVCSLIAVIFVYRAKKADIAVLERHKAFASELIERSQNLVMGLDSGGEIIIFNDKLEELTGFSRWEVIGKKWVDIFTPPASREKIRQTIEGLLAGGTVRDYQSSILTRNGETREVIWNGTVIKDENGKVVGIVGLGRDITERRLMREQLALFSSAFSHSTDAMLITDLRGGIVEINQAFTRLFGYEREEALGLNTRILRSKYSTDAFYKHMWESISSRGEWKGEITNRTKDGGEIPIWLSITPIILDGQKIGYMGIEIDMREKKELERRALEAERLAAVGKMSSQVAHEVRNPLSSISLNVELLREELTSILDTKEAKGNEARSLLSAIEKEVDRLSEIAGDYLKFSRLPQHKKVVTHLDEIIETMIRFLREEARTRGIELAFKTDPIPALLLDPKQLEQALMNLIKNAFDAMPSGGSVQVRLAYEPQGFAVISVQDTGMGMDENTRHRIFEPFFTTKEGGSGLGLSLVRQVVAEHGGNVWCESVRGKGTQFFIRIPCLKEEVQT